MRVIRKAIGLLIVDIVIIIGIFILQFRTDSSILKKIGHMQISMSTTENPDETLSLKNEFEVTYNGITIHSNPQNSVKILKKGSSVAKDLQLLEYEEDELKFTLHFTDQISLIFMVDKNEADAPLTIYADVPKDVTDLYVPYNLSFNMKIQREETNRIVLEGKKQNWSLHSNGVADNLIHFTYADNLAHYAIYDDTKKFSLDMLTELAEAQFSAYRQTLSSFNKNLQSAFKTSLNDSSYTELAVVNYIASMAEEGKYQQAIDEIPQDYKKSNTRTYLSAPYLNNLAAMDTKLDAFILDSNNAIKAAATSLSLEIFTDHDLAQRLCVYPDTSVVRALLSNAALATEDKLTVAQASGILLAYAELSNLYGDYAMLLKPALESCVQKITDACSYTDNVLTISENDTFVSVVQAVETGIALMRYGQISGDSICEKAGRVIINSYISESSSFDLRTLSTIYPMLAYDNVYYPRLQLIHSIAKDAIWAWTCSHHISYSKDEATGLTLSIDFPEGLTQYVILKGLPAFEQIFIYDMAFRTDPRFETYNSSGYVYRSDSKTLLLKSRHKSQIENVRMTYTPAAKTAPAPTPAPAASAATASATAPAATEAEAVEASEEAPAPEAKAPVSVPATIMSTGGTYIPGGRIIPDPSATTNTTSE